MACWEEFFPRGWESDFVTCGGEGLVSEVCCHERASFPEADEGPHRPRLGDGAFGRGSNQLEILAGKY